MSLYWRCLPYGVAIVATVLSSAALDYYYFLPKYQFWIENTPDRIRSLLFVLVALMMTLLSANLSANRGKVEHLKGQLIAESNDRLHIALNAAQMGMWDWNLGTGEITWSPEHEQLFGLPPGAFDGQYETFDERLHPDDRDGLNNAIADSLQNRIPYHHEYRIIWADGSVHWIEGRGRAFYNEVGEAVRMIGTILAIDERKQAQMLLQQQFEQQRLIMEISQRIRQSLNLPEILQTTVDEVRQLLQVDRVIIFEFGVEWGGRVTVESVGDEALAILPFDIYDPCISRSYVEPFQQGLVIAKADIYTADINPCHVEFLAQFHVRANLVVPILKHNTLWGLLAAHDCTAPHEWQDAEIELLRQLAAQLSIALQQAALLEQVQTELVERQQAEAALQQFNAELERRVVDRTAELAALNDRLLVAYQEQTHIQEALRDSEERRRLVLDLTHIGCWDWHLSSGNMIWNDNHYRLLGVIPDSCEPSYELWRSHVHPDDLSRVEPQFSESVKNQADYSAEYRVIHPDGSVHWLMARAQGIYDGAGQLLRSLGVLLDISDRKQVETALQQQTRQKQLLWTITQAIRQSLNLEVSLKAAVLEVRQLLRVDRVAIYRFNSNWSGDFIVESVADDWVKLVDADVCQVWEDTYLQETQGGRFQNHETLIVSDIYTAGLQPCHIELLEQFQARAYAIAPIFVGESLWGLFAFYHNRAPHTWQDWETELLQQIAGQLAIAIQQAELYNQLQAELQERRQTEAVLREAERRWRSLLENVQLIVVGLDQTGVVNYVNPFFLDLTGYRETDVLGQNWFENFLPAAHQQVTQTAFSELFNYKAHLYYQNPILTRFGEERWIAWNNTVLQDLDGHFIGTISMGEDVTERQQIEQMKHEFIGVVSHELRTPLTAIQMSLGLLKMGIYANKPDKAQRMIEIALTDTNRLVNLVNDILDLERLESGRAVLEKTVCPASELMQQAVNGMQAIATQHQITLTIVPTNVTVWAARDSIIQTLTNLLSNAIKFSPSGGTIWLNAEWGSGNRESGIGNREATGCGQQIEGTIQTSNLKPQTSSFPPSILFSITDQGRGIPADKLETIFGRFQQVDASDSREKGGTGLGLSICRSIVEWHGGKIWAESTLGQGSTFYFTLPLRSEPHE